MKKIDFFALFAILFVLLSGCSVTGLTARDKMDIADGIKTVHEEGNLPDTWKSEHGLDISVFHRGFGKSAEGTYCMTASVMVGNEQYMPPTYLCNMNGEWKTAKKTEPIQEPAISATKVVEIKTEIIPVKKMEILPIKSEKITPVVAPVAKAIEAKPAVVVVPKPKVQALQKINQPRKVAGGFTLLR